MKYIFDLYWFNHGGGGRNGIAAADYQTTPPGGWGNWTARHNVTYMTDMIAQRQDFTLMGVVSTLDYLNDKGTSYRFWTPQRKEEYATVFV